MHNTQQLMEWDKQYLWHPFTQMRDWMQQEQLIIERGEGVHLFDTEGRRYYDGISSLWVNVHGHNHPDLNRAVREQLDRIAHTTLLGLASPPSILLAKQLVELAPGRLSRVFYSDSGSTSVEIALKIAFQYQQQTGNSGKKKFIKFTNAYHGDTIGSVSVGGIDLFHRSYSPLLFDTVPVPYPDHFHEAGALSPEAYRDKCLQRCKQAISKHRGQIAALVVEPLVQGAAGMITMPAGFMAELQTLVRENGILLITDEVATGFGRTGRMFACEHEGIEPDLLCLAKGITAGYLPLAATLATEEVFAAFLGEYDEKRTFYHGHTYTGNPLACAAALESLRLFEQNRLLAHVRHNEVVLEEELERFRNHPHVGDVRRCGMMIGIELVASREGPQFYPFAQRMGHQVILEARKLGLIIRPLGDVVVLMPPLCCSEQEMRNILAITWQALEQTTRSHT